MRLRAKYIRGRSKQSQMLLAADNIHVFIWAPMTGADSFGMTVRWRSGRRWVHYRMLMLRRNTRARDNGSIREGHWIARPTLTVFEMSRWHTMGGTGERAGIKSYLRLKASAGGREA